MMNTDTKRKDAIMTLTTFKYPDRWAILAVGLIWVSILAGCQSMGQRDMGKYVPPGNRVAIKSGGPFDGRFETRDMTIAYQYRVAGNRLKVWGTSEIRFESINELVFHLYFLDERSTVISIHNFYSFLNHSDFIELMDNKRQFHRDFSIPEGAVAFAIGYDGETVRSQEEAGITFSHFPFE
jgi:hypothetical protein